MRNNRLKRLWPELKPKLEQIAKSLLKRYYWIDFEIDDLVQEGVIAIKRTKTTHDDPKNLSYLKQRAKLAMQKILKKEGFRRDNSKKLTYLMD